MAESGKDDLYLNLALSAVICIKSLWIHFGGQELSSLPNCIFPRFDNVRVPRENLLNSVADVSPDGKYLTAIKDPDQVNLIHLGNDS